MSSVRDKIVQARMDRAGTVEQPRAASTEDIRQKILAKRSQMAPPEVRAEPTRAPARSIASRGLPIGKQAYHKTSVLIALVAAEVIWILLYMLNAFSTSWGSQPIVRGVVNGFNNIVGFFDPASVIVLELWQYWAIGFAIAIAVTAIELHLWRVGNRLLFYTIGVPVMLFDLTTASFTVKLFFYGSLAGGTLGQNFWHTMGGDLISLAPEPMLVATSVTLYQVMKERRRLR